MDASKMEVESVMVTGTNRGIGLEFVRQLVNLPKPPRFLFATYRNENSTQALKEIRDASKETQVVLIKMDVAKDEDRKGAQKVVAGVVGDKGLNLLINNAGSIMWAGFPEITEDNLMFHFDVNTVGPVMVLKEMLPLLEKSAARMTKGMSVSRAAVLNISSGGGSMAKQHTDFLELWMTSMGYRISKAALNMSMRVVSLSVKDQGVLVVNIVPGWVKTKLGTKHAILEPSESVSAMMKTFFQLDESHQGAFLDRYGEAIPF